MAAVYADFVSELCNFDHSVAGEGLQLCHVVVLNGEAEDEGTVHDEDWGHEQEEVEPSQVVFSYALRCPRAVVVVPLYANVAVAAVVAPHWNLEPAKSAEPASRNAYVIWLGWEHF